MRWIVANDTIASRCLGIKKGYIGAPDKIVDRIAKFPFIDAKATSNLHQPVLGSDCPTRNPCSQPFGRRQGIRQCAFVKQCRKFFSTQPSNNSAFAQSFLRDHENHQVSNVIPELVVDFFEAVDVEDNRGQGTRSNSARARFLSFQEKCTTAEYSIGGTFQG